MKHGVAGSATTHFLEGHLAEPSLSRMHKVVETATNEAEAALRDHLLVSARLLCYHAGELLASSRVCCQFEPNEAGLDVKLCRRLVDEAENLALSAECAILHIRRARAALSQLFNWLKDLHTADSTENRANVIEKDDAHRFKLKTYDYQDMADLLKGDNSPVPVFSTSQTEALLNMNVMSLLSDPMGLARPNVSIDPIWPPPNTRRAEDVANQIGRIVQKEKQEARIISQTSQQPPWYKPLMESRVNDMSLILHTRLCSASPRAYYLISSILRTICNLIRSMWQ